MGLKISQNLENLIKSIIIEKNIYTNSEQIVGIYDGKPLYRKSFFNQTGPTSYYSNLYHYISNIDRVVKVYGTMRNLENNMTVDLPFAGTGSLYGNAVVCLRADTEKFQIECTSDYSRNKCDYFIEYTKTTD